MNDAAREALGRVIQNYGPSICQIPRSCEMFLRQECEPFPAESRALVEALRHGVTADLMAYRPDQSWDQFAGGLRQRLQSQGGLSETEGTWAVDAWARALGRHPEAWETAPDVVAVPPPESTHPSPAALKTVMTMIAALGGGFGGAFGSMLVPGILFFARAATHNMPFVSSSGRHLSKDELWAAVTIALLFIGLIGFVGGAAGAALGWLYGRGERGHWQGFAAAFGAAFTTSALAGYFCGIFGWLIGSFCAAFGAATTASRRGGWIEH